MALLFGLLAYLYYEVSVVLAMSAIGFALGTSLMVAIGVTWSWLIVVIGVIAGRRCSPWLRSSGTCRWCC